jgi:hypothetical protein
MPYTADHEPCSDCKDVDYALDAGSKVILINECKTSCEGTGGHSNPVFYQQHWGQQYCEKLACHINYSFEMFNCNCKFCPK